MSQLLQQQLVKLLISIRPSSQNQTFRTVPQVVKVLACQLKAGDQIQVAQNIDQFIQLLTQAKDNPQIPQAEKNLLYGFIVSIVKLYPKLVKTDRQRGAKIFELALDILFNVTAYIQEQWIHSTDVINQNDESLTVKQIMANTRKFVIAIGSSNALAIFQPIFLQDIIQSQNWRYIYSLLIVASQLAAKDAEAEYLSKIVQHAFALSNHLNLSSHPKVRYAALILIGQYIKDCETSFTQTCEDHFIFKTNIILQDPIPRVVGQYLTCLSHFYTKSNQLDKPLRLMLKQHISIATNYMSYGKNPMKIKAIDTLCSIAQIQDSFGSDLSQLYVLIDSTIKGSIAMKSMQVLGQALRLLSVLIANQNEEIMDIKDYTNLLFSHKDNIDKATFFACWTQICRSRSQFIDMTSLFPILFNDVKTYFDQSKSKFEGLTCLKETISSFKKQAIAHAAQIKAFCTDCFDYQDYQIEVFKEIHSLQLEIYSVTKPQKSQLQQVINTWGRQRGQALYSIIRSIVIKYRDKGYLFQQLPSLYNAILQPISNDPDTISNYDITALAEDILDLCFELKYVYDDLDKEYQELQENEYLETQPSEPEHFLDRVWTLKDGLRWQYQILLTLFRISKTKNLHKQMFQLYYTQIEPYLSVPFFAQYAQSTLVNCLVQIPVYQFHAQYKQVMKMLSQFEKNSDPRMRHAALQGYKIIFTYIDGALYKSQQVQQFLDFIFQQLNVRLMNTYSDSHNQFDARSCKDNVISALGRLLNHFGQPHPQILDQQVFKFWLNYLPINTDMEEGNQQQQILIEILAKSPQLIIKEPKDCRTICQIYAKYVMKRGHKRYKEEVSKTRKSFLMIKQMKQFKQSESYLQQNLSDIHQKVLDRLIAN